MKSISKFILFRLMKWKIVGNFPDLKKYIIIVAPHTSWIDFNIAILVKYATGLKANFIAKRSLFVFPFGYVLKALGGEPVDRSKSHNKVASVIKLFNTKDRFIFALAPEGTRQKVSKFKSGFYHIAQGANVPVLMVSLDFEHKEVKVSKPYTLTENKEQDFEYFYAYFKGVKGKTPKFSIGVDA